MKTGCVSECMFSMFTVSLFNATFVVLKTHHFTDQHKCNWLSVPFVEKRSDAIGIAVMKIRSSIECINHCPEGKQLKKSCNTLMTTFGHGCLKMKKRWFLASWHDFLVSRVMPENMKSEKTSFWFQKLTSSLWSFHSTPTFLHLISKVSQVSQHRPFWWLLSVPADSHCTDSLRLSSFWFGSFVVSSFRRPREHP